MAMEETVDISGIRSREPEAAASCEAFALALSYAARFA
jgi:hypothetical protein